MSIIASELVWRQSTGWSANADQTTDGGRMKVTSIPTGVKNNIFPDVPQSERTAGSTKFRKVFIHCANDADLTLVAPKVFVESRTPGDDNVTFIVGTQTNTKSQLSGSEQKYGSGKLNADVSIGGQSITVEVEDAALDMFVTGMKIRISNKASINASGDEEYLTITGTPSYVGNVATIATTTGLVHNYLATNSKVASVYEPGDVKATLDTWVEDNGAGDGTYDETTYPLVLDSIGTVEDSWTLTFSSATAFTVSGTNSGAVGGTGSINSPFAPTNTDYGKPYFTIPATVGWGGTWLNGNTITFNTHPAAIPLWYRRVVPAGASSLSGNSVIVAVDAESA